MIKKEVFLKYFTPCVLIVFFLLAFSNLTFGQEHLNLTGIIRAVDATTGIVRIQVTSERCTGLWNFKFPDYAKDDLDS
ncbi:MAG TPA: hypothetical protein PK800_06430, partial [Syntrophorhabdaceae bacterium]|nr:hypothetical protein [Syntrophorhabdaceae bacterium]